MRLSVTANEKTDAQIPYASGRVCAQSGLLQITIETIEHELDRDSTRCLVECFSSTKVYLFKPNGLDLIEFAVPGLKSWH